MEKIEVLVKALLSAFRISLAKIPVNTVISWCRGVLSYNKTDNSLNKKKKRTMALES